MTEPLLEIAGLNVAFGRGANQFDAVKNVSFALEKNETLILVGEIGSGKSVTALSDRKSVV